MRGKFMKYVQTVQLKSNRMTIFLLAQMGGERGEGVHKIGSCSLEEGNLQYFR